MYTDLFLYSYREKQAQEWEKNLIKGWKLNEKTFTNTLLLSVLYDFEFTLLYESVHLRLHVPECVTWVGNPAAPETASSHFLCLTELSECIGLSFSSGSTEGMFSFIRGWKDELEEVSSSLRTR